MSSLEVGLATDVDAEDLSEILLASFLEFQSQYTSSGFAATTPKADELRQRLLEGPIWIAKLNSRKVGTVSVVVKGRELYIRGMAVVPDARGAGVAVALFRAVDDYAKSVGCFREFLSTTPFLHRAIAFYRGIGFEEIGDGPTELFGTPLFTMERWI